jgi:hypothetical protein
MVGKDVVENQLIWKILTGHMAFCVGKRDSRR